MELTIWERAKIATRRALARGALGPITTETHVVHDGARFTVKLAAAVAAKERAAHPEHDPFADPDPTLRVSECSEAHVLLLNKYPVFAEHLLLVTRVYEEQTEPITEGDFTALYTCMNGSLAFYNSGQIAGASQRHKHLQLVRDVDAFFDPRQVRFPFAHVLTERPSEPGAAHRRYLEMLEEARVEMGKPYNLLVGREWMLIVPRTREHFESISVNALGFAGSILVKSHAELARVREVGPMTVLKSVTRP